MAQMTWRADDSLMDQVRSAARREGQSLNEFVTRVLSTATDPDLAGTENERIRERLARAGLLAEVGPPVTRPDHARVAAARRAAAVGTPLSDIVSRDRG